MGRIKYSQAGAVIGPIDHDADFPNDGMRTYNSDGTENVRLVALNDPDATPIHQVVGGEIKAWAGPSCLDVAWSAEHCDLVLQVDLRGHMGLCDYWCDPDASPGPPTGTNNCERVYTLTYDPVGGIWVSPLADEGVVCRAAIFCYEIDGLRYWVLLAGNAHAGEEDCFGLARCTWRRRAMHGEYRCPPGLYTSFSWTGYPDFCSGCGGDVTVYS